MQAGAYGVLPQGPGPCCPDPQAPPPCPLPAPPHRLSPTTPFRLRLEGYAPPPPAIVLGLSYPIPPVPALFLYALPGFPPTRSPTGSPTGYLKGGQPLLLVHPSTIPLRMHYPPTPLRSTDCPGRVPGAHPPPPDVPPTRYLRILLGGGYPPLPAPLGGVLHNAPPPPSPLPSFTKRAIPPTPVLLRGG